MATFSQQISNGVNDAEEHGGEGGYWHGGETENASSDLELCWEVDNSQHVGVRFTNVTIPQGSTINSSYVRFIIDVAKSDAVSINIYGEDIDDAPSFSNETTPGTGTFNISSRTPTTASVTWNIASGASPNVNDTLDTADISTIIQEIVNRPGWASGNDLVVIFSHISGTSWREVESYDGEPGDAPRINIDYTAPSAGTSRRLALLGIGS
jgi:hypothetical protein